MSNLFEGMEESKPDQENNGQEENNNTNNGAENNQDNSQDGNNNQSESKGDQENQSELNEWFLADGVKGEGDKPEWLSEKHKTVMEQAKNYTELEKKLGNFTGAPEEYDFSIESEQLSFDKEDPIMQEFADFAKQNNMNQELFSGLLNKYASTIEKSLPNKEEELQKIGVNANRDLQILHNWANSNLDQDEYKVFKEMVTTADSFKLFNKLRVMANKPEIANTRVSDNTENEQAVRRMIHDPRFETDPSYREMVEKKMAMIKN